MGIVNAFPAAIADGGNASANDIIITGSTKAFSYENTTATKIRSECFSGFYSYFTSVTFTACTEIGSYAFCKCYSLKTAVFPEVLSIYQAAFQSCSSLTTISFPKCKKINVAAFYDCRALVTASFPALTSVNNNGFAHCSNLTTVTLNVCSFLYSGAFYMCSKLSQLYLLSTKVVTLENLSAFDFTPIKSQTASIWVRASLYNAYKTASYWSQISAKIKSIT